MDGWKFFGRLVGKPDAAPEEVAVEGARRLNAPVATAELIEAAAPLRAVGAAAEDPNTVTLAKAEHTELLTFKAQAEQFKARVETLEAEKAAAEQEQAEAEARRAVETYVTLGKIAPKQREDALAFALADPVRFKALYDNAAPQVDLSRLGGLQAGTPGSESGGSTSFLGKVSERQRKDGLDFTAAAALVAADEPDLYDQYRRQTMGRA